MCLCDMSGVVCNLMVVCATLSFLHNTLFLTQLLSTIACVHYYTPPTLTPSTQTLSV